MAENTHIINKNRLGLIDLHNILFQGQKIKLSEESIDAIEQCRTYLDEKITTTDAPIYGVNTGFGSLCDKKIDNSDLGKLQANLVKSHACGIGDEVPHEIVKLMDYNSCEINGPRAIDDRRRYKKQEKCDKTRRRRKIRHK